jgi:phosphate/phosphite/phosphonate ABC transporters, periplasmic binding protein
LKKSLLLTLTVFVLISILAGCSSNDGGKLDKFTVVYLPQESDEQAQQLNKDFEDKLSEKLGVPVESIKANSYNAAIEAMKNGKADYAMFGPFSYIVAVDRAKVEPVAEITIPSMANGPASVIFVPKDSPIQTVADLKGKTFGFVDPVSTTGHLLPKYTIVNELGISVDELDSFFKDVQFAGGHDKAIIGAARGQYDAAASSPMVINMMEEKGVIEKGSLRVIAESESLPGTVIGIRGDLPEDVKTKVKEFLLSYDNAEYFSMLGMAGAKFVEANDSNYDHLRQIAKDLKLSSDELLQ